MKSGYLDRIKLGVWELSKKIIPDKIFDCLYSRYYLMCLRRNRTPDALKGYYYKNPRKGAKANYLLLRFDQLDLGFFAVANIYMLYSQWARRSNLIPLVDYEIHQVFEKGHFEENNIWNLIFKQPVTVKEAFENGNVYVERENNGMVLRATMRKLNGNPEDHVIRCKDDNFQCYYKFLNEISLKEWCFNSEVELRIKREEKRLFKTGMSVMAVLLREEFGRNEIAMSEKQLELYRQHPRALSLEHTLELIKEYMEKWNCTHVLITTMFMESVCFFEERLGDKALFVQRKRNYMNEVEKVLKVTIDKPNLVTNEMLKAKVGDERHIGYIVEMAVAARCDYLAGTRSCGFQAVCIMNGGQYKGIYPFPDANNCTRC